MPSEVRYGELDALRGIAVLMMIAYHGAFDLAYFYGWDIPVREGWWLVFARSTATVFLLLVGVCFVISWESEETGIRNQGKAQRAALLSLIPDSCFLHAYPKYLKRGLTVFTGGMLLSLITWFVTPDAFIKFGILHLIGMSALLQPIFARFGEWNAIIGIAAAALGTHFATLTTSSTLLFPLGIPYPGFASLDYYPLLPWFGVILIGMAAGSALYVPDRHRFPTPLSLFPFPLSLLWIGRRALWIYFLHQPVLLLLLALMLGTPMQR